MNNNLIAIKDVPKVVLGHFGEKRTTAAVYHWIRVGVAGPDGVRIKLQTTKCVGKLYTTFSNIEKFIREM